MSKKYKDDQLKKEINNSFTSFKPVINANHINHIKGWSFDPQRRFLMIFKHGSWYTYLPEGRQVGSSEKSKTDALRQVHNFLDKQKVSQSGEIQQKTLQEAIQKIDQATENTQEATQEEIETRKDEKELYTEINEESELTGESPIDIINLSFGFMNLKYSWISQFR